MLNAPVALRHVLGRLRVPAEDGLAPREEATVEVGGPRGERRRPVVARLQRTVVAPLQRTVVAAVAMSQLGPLPDEADTLDEFELQPATVHSADVAAADVPAEEVPVHPRPSVLARIGADRVITAALTAILLGASAVSVSAVPVLPSTGGPTADGPAPRIAIGGGMPASVDDQVGNVEFADPDRSARTRSTFAPIDVGVTEDVGRPIEPRVAGDPADPGVETPPTATLGTPTRATGKSAVEGPFVDDGTLVKPVAVDTIVPDGSALVKTYTVKRGDTLEKIAEKYTIAPTTIWWANKLQSTELTEGDLLRVPQVDGLIVDVEATDTLDAIATRYAVTGTKILETNGLDDPNLVVGQVIVVPGAKGEPMPVEKPKPAPGQKGAAPKAREAANPGATDAGGKFMWPVVGGDNYVSQHFHYGHYAIDIAADYGSTVRSVAGGTVTFAGWKSNGGGYQVWISHGSGLFTTYNHMSSITVGVGQKVERGRQVGRVGQSGRATGPHLHFEVWRGEVWDGGQRINPMGYF